MKPMQAVNTAYREARSRDPDCAGFVIDGVEYRRTVMSDEPPLAWSVWVSELGDIVVDKNDAASMVRLTQTLNEGYLYVSVERLQPNADRYLRRRVHEWVAHAFHGPPPEPDSIVEHIDDNPFHNHFRNVTWSDQVRNRARRTANVSAGIAPAGKHRNILLSMRVVRLARDRTGFKGRRLSAYVEQLILSDLSPR